MFWIVYLVSLLNIIARISSDSFSTKSLYVFCSWWLHSENLATYEQQDAHEFFISILDQIHEKESKNLKLNRGGCYS